MRKFKVGDKVIIVSNPCIPSLLNAKAEVTYVEPDDYDGKMVYEIVVKRNGLDKRYFWVKENWISFDPENTFKRTDDEIYDMLKPKMEKMGINYNGELYNTYMPIEDVKRLVATIYRSGYIRGQKGRPFVIGEKKEKGHWVPCQHGEELTPGTKLRRNHIKYCDVDWCIAKIPVGTEVEVLNGAKDSYINVLLNKNWVSFPGGDNGKNEEPYDKFEELTGFYVIYIDSCTEYFDKWVEK